MRRVWVSRSRRAALVPRQVVNASEITSRSYRGTLTLRGVVPVG